MSTLKHAVFENLEKHKLKLNPKKCDFLIGKVVYLGHMVSAESIHMDPTKQMQWWIGQLPNAQKGFLEIPWIQWLLEVLFVWFDSLRSINNLEVVKGQVFLGWTSSKLG